MSGFGNNLSNSSRCDGLMPANNGNYLSLKQCIRSDLACSKIANVYNVGTAILVQNLTANGRSYIGKDSLDGCQRNI